MTEKLKHKDLLHRILSQPSAPFREEAVRKVITEALRGGGVPCFEDPIGNIVIGAASKAEYFAMLRRKTDDPIRIFMAHLDHPGFHGLKWRSSDTLEIKWFGGSPVEYLEGSAVWISDSDGDVTEGRLTQPKLAKHGKAIDTALVKIPSGKQPGIEATSLFGGFRFRAPVWEEGNIIYTKAADDLAGAFAVVSLALTLSSKIKTRKFPFIGLLTRAEEVGFIGAIGHFTLGWHNKAKRPLVCVSIECSRELPGAEIGRGPVVRLGDRFTTFDPASTHVFAAVAEKTLPGAYQKKLMDGGTCEASAATVFGVPAIGISVPLGNYHNQAFEPLSKGKASSYKAGGPAPECVHAKDVAGVIALAHGLMKPGLPWNSAFKEKAKQFKSSLKHYRKYLT